MEGWSLLVGGPVMALMVSLQLWILVRLFDLNGQVNRALSRIDTHIESYGVKMEHPTYGD
jgi:hypothetical protein